MSLKDTKFSIRQCSLILLPEEVVSGSSRCSACPAALMPSGMLLAGTCSVVLLNKVQAEIVPICVRKGHMQRKVDQSQKHLWIQLVQRKDSGTAESDVNPAPIADASWLLVCGKSSSHGWQPWRHRLASQIVAAVVIRIAAARA